MRDNTKKPSDVVKGHWRTIKGRIYDSPKQFRQRFDEDGKELVIKFGEKLTKDAPYIWLRSSAAIHPKDTRLQPFFKNGRIPGKTKREQMRYLYETRKMTVPQKVQWLEKQGYPKYGRKASEADSQR